MNVLQGKSLFETSGDIIYQLITGLPLHLQKELSHQILGLAWRLDLSKDLAFAVTIMHRLDAAFVAMKNGSINGVPPNFFKLLRWYNNYGTTTLQIWLEALYTESLHDFLVENPLPVLLNDTVNFFCGPSALDNLGRYFNQSSLPPIQMSLCQINWMMVGPEVVGFYTRDMQKNDSNIFEAVGAVYKLATESLIDEGMKIYAAVLPFYERALQYSEIDL